MTLTMTFGQVAYETWQAKVPSVLQRMRPMKWAELPKDERDRWEATAQAVIDAKEEHDSFVCEADPFGIGWDE